MINVAKTNSSENVENCQNTTKIGTFRNYNQEWMKRHGMTLLPKKMSRRNIKQTPRYLQKLWKLWICLCHHHPSANNGHVAGPLSQNDSSCGLG